MDPSRFVRILVGSLVLKIPVATKPARSGVHPSTTPCFCEIRLKNFPMQTATVLLIPPENPFPEGQTIPLAATFHLNQIDLENLAAKSIFSGKPCLKVAIYTGRRGTNCGLSTGRLLGRISIPLDLTGSESKACVFHNGWTSVGNNSKGPSAQFHICVRSEPDPRFVFQFDGEPECSPQVFQIQGDLRQPVFTCKFSFRNSGERNNRSRSVQSDPSSSRNWLTSLGSDRERPLKERKGWSVTIHDLSGSPVAVASMITPFVASPNSDRVSRSNPGAWLILLPGDGTWKPWGRLEAWRDRGTSDTLGYRFELTPDAVCGGITSAGILLTESSFTTNNGGKFIIDTSSTVFSSPKSTNSGGSSELGQSSWPYCLYRGFVMSSTVEGEGKCSRPVVEVGVHQVSCIEDAAAFIALSAAIDLSMDACRLFSRKLRKELCPEKQEPL